MEQLSVIISDNQLLTNIGITSILLKYYKDGIIFYEARTKDEISEKLESEDIHVLIVDYELIDFDNITDFEIIIHKFPAVGILVISGNQNPEFILNVLESGVKNYLIKTCTENELIEAFKSTLEGRKYFSNKVLDVLLNKNTSARNRKETGKLTLAEIEIVRLITQ